MKFVYVVYKNSDMTEGRGPMVVDSIFQDETDAKRYIDTKSGVMGRKMVWSEEKYGDWKVKEVAVHAVGSTPEQIQDDKLYESAMEKLTDDEKRVLGVI